MKKCIRLIAVLLCLTALCAGTVVSAAAADMENEAEPMRASDYIDYYNAWLVTGSGGKIYINYDIDGTGRMGTIGAKLIAMQVKDANVWSNVKNYSGTVANGMYAQNTSSHSGVITYYGTPGRDYRAIVTFYAGDSTGGDTRILTTNAVRAHA